MGKREHPEWAIDVLKKIVDLGIEQKEVAEMIGISKQHFCNIMKGESPDSMHIARINETIDQLHREKFGGE